MRIEQLHREYHVEVRWVAHPLYHDLPADGRSIEDLFKGTSIDISKVELRIRDAATREGLPLCDGRRIYNTRLAHELAKWAENQGHGNVFHAAVFRAYFAEGRNIGDPSELAGIAAGLGLDPDESKRVMALRSRSAAVDADLKMAAEFGVTAVPAFVIEGDTFTGAHPYEELVAFAKRKGVYPRL